MLKQLLEHVRYLVAEQQPIDALTYTGAVAILVAALSLFRPKPSHYETATPVSAVSPGPHGDNPPPA